MFCIGYDADTGQKYYVDSKADTYTGAPGADYGVLTPTRGTPPLPYVSTDDHETITVVDCEPMIPRRPHTREKELNPKHQNISNGVGATTSQVLLDHSKTHRANTVGTWPPRGWGPYVSTTTANKDPSGDEGETDAQDSGTSDYEEGIKQATIFTTPQIGEYIFDQDTLTFVPPAGATVESPTDSIPILPSSSPVPADVNQHPLRRHTMAMDGVSDAAVEPQDQVGSAGKKKRKTFLHKLLRIH